MRIDGFSEAALRGLVFILIAGLVTEKQKISSSEPNQNAIIVGSPFLTVKAVQPYA